MLRPQVVAALLMAHGLAAQSSVTPVRIPDEPSCARCTITTRPVVTLASPTDAVVDRPWNVSRDNSGRYWMLLEGELPAVYDSTGRFARSVGRKGSGPGEYQGVQEVIFAGDSAVIFDPGNARVTIVDATLTAKRQSTTPFQLINPVVGAWPVIVALNGPAGPRVKLPPFHRISLSGNSATIVRSFGETTAFWPELGFTPTHFFAPAPAGHVWAAWYYGYNLSEWSAEGSLVRAIERRPAWFLSEKPSRMGNPTTPPDAVIANITRDADGLLWIFIRVPAQTWKEGWPELKPGQREVMARSIQYEKMYTTTIEVIDPRAGRVVARQNFDRYLLNAMPGGRGVFFARTADGDARTSVVQFTLTGR